MRNDFIDAYDAFLNAWGYDAQSDMCIEEMSELTKEICKLKRFTGTDRESEVVQHIKEEIADVLNMAEQLEYFFGEEEIENIRKEKIERTYKRLNN